MSDEKDGHDELDLEEEELPGAGGVAAWLLPFGTSFVALAIGALIGAGVMGLMPRKATLVEVSEDLTNEELDALCAPKVDEAVADAADTLQEAESKVRTLEAQVAAKEKQIGELEGEMERRADKGEALALQLRAAKAELGALEDKLELALKEKEELVVELRKTEMQLEEQVAKTELAKEEGMVFKWRSFIGLAQLQICEKGGRRKMGRCRETVAAALDGEIRNEFERCLKAGQETASVLELDKKAELPAFSVWIDEDSRITKGWYVRLCDPTLPEAKEFAPLDLDETTEQALGGG